MFKFNSNDVNSIVKKGYMTCFPPFMRISELYHRLNKGEIENSDSNISINDFISVNLPANWNDISTAIDDLFKKIEEFSKKYPFLHHTKQMNSSCVYASELKANFDCLLHQPSTLFLQKRTKFPHYNLSDS